MRLCYVANPHSIHTQRWLRHFVQLGHKVHLLGVSPSQAPLPADALPSAVVFHDLTARANVQKLRFLIWGLLARRIVRRIQPDLLHAHQVAGAGWVGVATGFHPFVVTAWGSDLLVGPKRSRSQRFLARQVLQRADRIWCVSEELAQAARALGAGLDRITVAPLGVNTEVFCPAPEEAGGRQPRNLEKRPVVLSLRAMRPIYNPLDIAQAIPLVLAEVPQALFFVRTYGHDPGLLAQFRTIIADHGVADAVQYIGDLADDRAIADLYRLAAVGLSVAASDGTPVSVLEAMACGLPMVASDLTSLREWIRNGENGMLVPVGDVEALADAIIQLLREPQTRARFAEHSLSLVRDRASFETEMAKVEAQYDALLECTREGRQTI